MDEEPEGCFNLIGILSPRRLSHGVLDTIGRALLYIDVRVDGKYAAAL
jgi:hypothetical protein